MMAARTLEYIAGKAPRYEVIAAAAVVKTNDGPQQYVYRGDWLPLDTAQQSIDHCLAENLIRAVGTAS